MTHAPAAFPPDFYDWIERLRQTFDVPGLAIAVMHQGAAHVRCYGVRRLGSAEPVDRRTVFPIGSNTKAITAACIGLLLDEGRLALDERVRRYLPWFRMHDPVADAQITLRDLLLHRSGLGLGAGDLLIYPQTTLTRAEVVRAIGHIPSATAFRSAYAYDNLLYIVLGAVIEQITGQSWEDFVRSRIFGPLGMTDAVPSGATLEGVAYAWPHAKIDPPLRGTGASRPMAHIPAIGSAAPAGGIYASAPAMTAWLSTLLSRGIGPDGRRLYSAAVAEALWTPQIDVPIDEDWPGFAETRPTRQGYGLGLLVQERCGERIISHGGAILGSVSHLVLAPERGFGAIVMANTDGSICARAVALHLLDLQVGHTRGDRLAAASSMVEAARRTASDRLAGSEWHTGFVPQRDPGDYVGHYRDAWYGPAQVTQREGALVLMLEHSPGLEARLQPIDDDRFVARWHDPLAEPAVVAFHRTADQVVRMTLTPESPFADFSFDFQDLRFERRQ